MAAMMRGMVLIFSAIWHNPTRQSSLARSGCRGSRFRNRLPSKPYLSARRAQRAPHRPTFQEGHRRWATGLLNIFPATFRNTLAAFAVASSEAQCQDSPGAGLGGRVSLLRACVTTLKSDHLGAKDSPATGQGFRLSGATLAGLIALYHLPRLPMPSPSVAQQNNDAGPLCPVVTFLGGLCKVPPRP